MTDVERPARVGRAAREGWSGLALAAGISLVCLLVSLAFGPVSLSPAQLWHDLLAGPGSHTATAIIFWQIRAPRVVLAFLVGAALAVAGVILVGVVNVAVSYSLAFATAFRARHVRYERAGLVMRLVLKRLIRRPHDFVWPPHVATTAAA